MRAGWAWYRALHIAYCGWSGTALSRRLLRLARRYSSEGRSVSAYRNAHQRQALKPALTQTFASSCGAIGGAARAGAASGDLSAACAG